MRHTFTILVASAMLVMGTQTVLGQYVVEKGKEKKTPAEGKEKDIKKKETPAPLDQLIDEALANNPDIRIAEASVHAKETELARARLRVVSDLTIAYAEINAAQAGVEEGEKRLAFAKLRFDKGQINVEDYGAASLTFTKLKAELISSKARLPILLGRQSAKTASLDELIAEARANNLDIRVAEAKVREGEAELARVRLKVISDLTFLHAEIEAARAGAEEGRIRLDRAKTLLDNKVLSHEDYGAAVLTSMKLKSELAFHQAKLPYLLGKQTSWKSTRLDQTIVEFMLKEASTGVRSDEEFLRRVMVDIHGRLPTVAEMKDFLKMPEKDRREKWTDLLKKEERPPDYQTRALAWLALQQLSRIDFPLDDKLRKALDTPMAMTRDFNSPNEIMELVRKILPGVNVNDRTVRRAMPGTYPLIPGPEKPAKIRIAFSEPIPTGAFLQYLEDELHWVFVLRDYGVVVISADERLPPGAIVVTDFWKRGKQTETSSPKK